MKLAEGMFVINKAAVDVLGIVINSVGIIKECLTDDNYDVFFIGKSTHCKVHKDILDYIDPYMLNKESKVKICNVCHILKPMDEFQINQTDASGRKTRRPSCNACRELIDGKKLLDSEKRRMKAIEPKGVFTCPICGKTSIARATASLVIDHDHKSGLARAWICDSCNTGLGRFKDDVQLMRVAIKYLESFEESQNSTSE